MKKFLYTLLVVLVFTNCKQSIKKDTFTLEDSRRMLYMGIYNNTNGVSTEKVGNQIQQSMKDLMKFYEAHDYSFDPVSGSFMLNLNERGEYVNFLPFSKKERTPKNDYGIKLGETFRATALKGIHLGTYSSVEKTYEKMFKYIDDKGWINLGYATEMYMTDPAIEKDPSKWETEISLAVETKPHGHIEVTQLPELSYVSVRNEVSKEENLSIEQSLGRQMYEMNQKVMTALNKSNIHPPYVTGFNIIHNRTEQQVDFEFCVPVPISTASEDVQFTNLTSKKALKVVHHGTYEFSESYKKAYTYAVANGLKLHDISYEFYMNDPRKQKDVSKNVTHIYIPFLQKISKN